MVPLLAMLRMLPALPILRMLPALAMLRTLPLEAIEKRLMKLATQPTLPTLNRLSALAALNSARQLLNEEVRPPLRRIHNNRTVSIDTTVRAQLDELGVPFEIFPCDPDLADTAAFCAAYGFAPEDSANTILVIGKSEPPVYAACVVLATTRLDVNRAVRSRLGTRKASFAPADETRAITGMEIGGVTVFGLPPSLPIWIDARVMERERIVLGGGNRSTKILAPPAILEALPNAEVVPDLATAPGLGA
jgi:prolyl-tRNA editing enzyme YbaK/EbsC (Cys-tRNA(Pro) deacylase)